MKTVPLNGAKAAGRVALVDDEDYELVAPYKWHVLEQHRPGRNAGPYAATTLRIDNVTGPTILMHCLILGALGVDHRNGDGLDNQRHNLRVATDVQNRRNQRPRIGTSSAYKGLTWDRQRRKWQVRIKVDCKARHLGRFTDEIEAARVYDAAARELFGEFAWLNFPEATGSD